MEAQPDFRELLALFNEWKVDYMIVGGYALAFHGAPRFTGDLDIWVRPDRENAERILAALDQFGFGSLGLKISDLTEPESVVQLGFPPVRVDIMNSLTGLNWEDAAPHRVEGEYGGIRVPFIGRDQFVANKRALGRARDLADIEAIGETTGR